MKKVIFTHVNFIGNAGDWNCSPFDYYQFPFDYELVHYMDFMKILTENDFYFNHKFKNRIIIIGGGGLITTKGNHLQEILRYLVKHNKIILWGVGSNTDCDVDWDILNHKNVVLAGIRDRVYGINAEYLPCVSCKHSLFDQPQPISKGLGFHAHRLEQMPISDDVILNNKSIEEIINYFSSKEAIITTSYHGAYWAQLLNKKVVYYNKNKNEVINSKFLNLKHGINVCNSENYKEILEIASSPIGLLKESRYLNDKFYTKVVNIIQNLQE
jgi:hypothetical protein